MKSADIEVGKEYAVGPVWRAKRSRYSGGLRSLGRALVLETRVDLRTNSYYGGSTTKSGVKVKWLGSEDGSRRNPVIPSREVHQLWSEYEAEEKAYAEAKAKREDDENAKYSAAVKRIEAVLPDDLRYEDVPFRGRKSWQIEPLADLLEKVYEAGRKEQEIEAVEGRIARSDAGA